MRVFIQKLAGVHLGAQGEVAERGFCSLGIECHEFLADDDIEGLERGDLVLGNRLVVGRRLRDLGIDATLDAYPEALSAVMPPSVRAMDAQDLRKEDLPAFLRPRGGDAFEPVCAYEMADLVASGVKGRVWASEVMWFEATWRLFCRHGERVALLGLEGDPRVVCDDAFVERCRLLWEDMPAACALDFGVTEGGETTVVCARDVLKVSPVGLDARSWALLLSARWAELAGVADPLADVACP